MKKDDFVFTCYFWKNDEIVYINSVKSQTPMIISCVLK